MSKRYKECNKKCRCKWRMAKTHCDGYNYLNNACYLSGAFQLDCPPEKIPPTTSKPTGQ